jgi:hypothetical protein
LKESERIDNSSAALLYEAALAFSFMPNHLLTTSVETSEARFERVLSCEPFQGLKAILDSLSAHPEALFGAVNGANSYEELLARLGFRVTLTKQIHVQDCYSRVGPAGGIRAVLPYYDIPTQSSMPTLVNFDGTVTTTSKSISFFNAIFLQLKSQLSSAEIH